VGGQDRRAGDECQQVEEQEGAHPAQARVADEHLPVGLPDRLGRHGRLGKQCPPQIPHQAPPEQVDAILFDAAGRGTRAAADQHQDDQDCPAKGVPVPVADGGEARRRQGRHGLEDGHPGALAQRRVQPAGGQQEQQGGAERQEQAHQADFAIATGGAELALKQHPGGEEAQVAQDHQGHRHRLHGR